MSMLSGLQRGVVLLVDTQRFGEHTASIFRNTLNMEAVCFSETLVSTCKSTPRCNPEHRHEILNSVPWPTLTGYMPSVVRTK
jgi:hypothetical protein